MSFLEESPETAASPAEATLRELYGFVPRVFRLQVAAVPEIAGAEAEMLAAMLNEKYLSRTQKEKMMLAAAATAGCPYGVALHEQMLKVMGGSEREAEAIVGGVTPEGEDGALVRFTRQLVAAGNQMDLRDIDALRRAGLSETQIVEAIVVAGISRFLNTVELGTGVVPDFRPRAIPALPTPGEKKMYPEPSLSRPMGEEAAPDPDGELVEQVQRGNLEAFEVLVERHSQRVYRTLVGLLGNPDEAKDAMQDTFLKAFQNLPQFERRAKFSTWLVSIAGNTGLQRLRERKNMESLDDDGSDHDEFRPRQIRAWTEDPEQLYSKAERKSLVERSILHLPAKYRVALLLRDVQQLTTEDAAAALGLGIPALKARVLRGRLMLREALAPHFSEGAQPA